MLINITAHTDVCVCYCRTPDSAGLQDTLRRTQKVVATLTFRKHLYSLFPSGHHLSDDYCQLLVAHFRRLASCLCKCLAATNARLPDGSSPAKVKSWVTFLMGWESVAAAPRLLHIVEQARILTDFSSVLLTQTQVRIGFICSIRALCPFGRDLLSVFSPCSLGYSRLPLTHPAFQYLFSELVAGVFYRQKNPT